VSRPLSPIKSPKYLFLLCFIIFSYISKDDWFLPETVSFRNHWAFWRNV
jgi:hypothetical protein